MWGFVSVVAPAKVPRKLTGPKLRASGFSSASSRGYRLAMVVITTTAKNPMSLRAWPFSTYSSSTRTPKSCDHTLCPVASSAPMANRTPSIAPRPLMASLISLRTLKPSAGGGASAAAAAAGRPSGPHVAPAAGDGTSGGSSA